MGDFLGGEPTLHPNLDALLDIVQDQDMRCNLSSNGTRVDLLEFLSKRYEKDFLKIGVSLQDTAVSAELHEYILSHRPVLKSLMERNGAIPAGCAVYADMAGIEYFLLFRDAVGPDDLEECMPFPAYHRRLSLLRKAHPGIRGVFCAGFIEDGALSGAQRPVRCPAGTTKLSMLPDGSVYPCYLLFRYPEFALGNILRDGFQRIWENPILRFFRTFSHDSCPEKDCSFSPSCHGGCPAHGYALCHDLTAPDPRCVFPLHH